MANPEKTFNALLKLYSKRDAITNQISKAEKQLLSEAQKPPKVIKKPKVKKRATGKKAVAAKKR